MGKTILITGATSGFGKACAEHFAAQGWKMILTGRRVERLEQLQDQLGEAVQQIIPLDVRDREQVFEQLGSLKEVDVLLNNAGLALGLEPSWKVDINDWDTMVDTNIKGLMYCTRALLPQMVERDSGHIVNIGSTAGSWPYPGGNTYGGTKAFVQQFSRNLRADLISTRVRVTNVAPGMAESEFSNVRFKGDDEQAAKVYQGVEALRPEDIAESVFWIVNRPAHVNINAIEIMSVDQAWGPFAIDRK
ncbi:MAG: SDR family oxidoreductase [Desulfuromusa sp.]|jgi:NADP-dependent 3-hydroxy acid dehydrogenase YdfG|nr:SDR family oxidoreductase [Desulfuromusa sp.]